MTDSPSLYTLPELITLQTNKFDLAPPFKPELTCLNRGKGQTRRYWYTYRVCYLDRRSLDPTIKSLKEREKVNLSSLCPKRASLIQPIIKGLLEGHPGIPQFNSIESALDWIDQQDRSAELHSQEGTRRLYHDYTDLLHHRLRLSNVGNTTQSISYPMAQKLQTALAYVCSLAVGYGTDSNESIQHTILA